MVPSPGCATLLIILAVWKLHAYRQEHNYLYLLLSSGHVWIILKICVFPYHGGSCGRKLERNSFGPNGKNPFIIFHFHGCSFFFRIFTPPPPPASEKLSRWRLLSTVTHLQTRQPPGTAMVTTNTPIFAVRQKRFFTWRHHRITRALGFSPPTTPMRKWFLQPVPRNENDNFWP